MSNRHTIAAIVFMARLLITGTSCEPLANKAACKAADFILHASLMMVEDKVWRRRKQNRDNSRRSLHEKHRW